MLCTTEILENWELYKDAIHTIHKEIVANKIENKVEYLKKRKQELGLDKLSDFHFDQLLMVSDSLLPASNANPEEQKKATAEPQKVETSKN